jgi:hypothetical protein
MVVVILDDLRNGFGGGDTYFASNKQRYNTVLHSVSFLLEGFTISRFFVFWCFQSFSPCVKIHVGSGLPLSTIVPC